MFQLATEEGGRAVAKLIMGVGADDMAYLQPQLPEKKAKGSCLKPK